MFQSKRLQLDHLDGTDAMVEDEEEGEDGDEEEEEVADENQESHSAY